MSSKPVRTPKKDPWHPHDWDAATAYAIKALATGTASPEQQRYAIQWIIDACSTYDLSFRPDSERATTFAEGKRHIGLQLVKLVNLPAAAIPKGSPHV